ncbi:metallophosphoesterase [Clostridium sediminicola]|uniref:metallophosphoesterase n=1 Tax=Clostridium sediminicola TaxID=3114879 RepID=UPI0031F27E4B
MKKKKITIICLFILSIISFCYIENNFIKVNRMEIENEEIPKAFNEYKIVQLSDLHSKLFGKEQKRLVKKVLKEEPDIIVFTGDLIDSKNYNEENSLILMEKLIEASPVYYVTGNHEKWSGKFDDLEEKLIALGVKVLRNESIDIFHNENRIALTGIDDPDFQNNSYNINDTEIEGWDTFIDGLEENKFNILLSHRPELFSNYDIIKFNLVFSGHAHGGQVRLPFIGGVVAPNQGFFPEYLSGIYKGQNTLMVVNRGLGNSIIPQRLFNRPEIIVVTLKNE